MTEPTTTTTEDPKKTRNTGRVVIQSEEQSMNASDDELKNWSDVSNPCIVKKKGLTPEDVTTTEDAKAWIVAEGKDGKRYRIIRVMHVVTARQVTQTKLIED